MARLTNDGSGAVRKRKHLLEVIDGFDTAMLVTRTGEGELRSRPLAVAECQPDGTIYFATSARSGKADELAGDPHVNVTLQGPRRYASISGRGELLRDRALVDRLWSEAWKVWFPEGKDDPELCILAVRPEQAELWDQSGARGLRYALDSARAYLSGRRPRTREEQNTKLDATDLAAAVDGPAPARGWHPLAAGLGGAVALTLAHEVGRRLVADAPRMDLAGSRGLARLLGRRRRAPYAASLGADLLANTLYYAAAFSRGPARPWSRGLLVGALAGAGANAFAPRLGLTSGRHQRRPGTQRMTVAWYALGGLAAACYRALRGARA